MAFPHQAPGKLWITAKMQMNVAGQSVAYLEALLKPLRKGFHLVAAVDRWGTYNLREMEEVAPDPLPRWKENIARRHYYFGVRKLELPDHACPKGKDAAKWEALAARVFDSLTQVHQPSALSAWLLYARVCLFVADRLHLPQRLFSTVMRKLVGFR